MIDPKEFSKFHQEFESLDLAKKKKEEEEQQKEKERQELEARKLEEAKKEEEKRKRDGAFQTFREKAERIQKIAEENKGLGDRISQVSQKYSQEKIGVVDQLLQEDEPFYNPLEEDNVFVKMVYDNYPRIAWATSNVLEDIRKEITERCELALKKTTDQDKQEILLYQQQRELTCLNELFSILREAKREGKILTVKNWLQRIYLLVAPIQQGVAMQVENLVNSLQTADETIKAMGLVNKKFKQEKGKAMEEEVFGEVTQDTLIFPEDLQMQARYEEERNMLGEVLETKRKFEQQAKEEVLNVREFRVETKEAFLYQFAHIRDTMFQVQKEKAAIETEIQSHELRKEKNEFHLNEKLFELHKIQHEISVEEKRLQIDSVRQQLELSNYALDIERKEYENYLNYTRQALDVDKKHHDLSKLVDEINLSEEQLSLEKKENELTFNQWRLENFYEQWQNERQRKEEDERYQAKTRDLEKMLSELKYQGEQQEIEYAKQILDLKQTALNNYRDEVNVDFKKHILSLDKEELKILEKERKHGKEKLELEREKTDFYFESREFKTEKRFHDMKRKLFREYTQWRENQNKVY